MRASIKLSPGLVFVWALLVLISGHLGQTDAVQESEQDAAVQPRIKLFDFEHFKQLFGKRYSSLAEELARARIFMANALKVFFRWFRFTHGHTTSYSSLNEMSDWTKSELYQIYNYGGKPDSSDLGAHESDSQEALDLTDVQCELAQIDELDQRELDKLVPDADDLDQVEPSDQLVGQAPTDTREHGQREPSRSGTQQAEPSAEGSSFRLTNLGIQNFVREKVRKAFECVSPSKLDEPIEREDLPDEIFVDHSSSDCMTAVRVQGRCGSCYIFAAIALIEFDHCAQTGKLVEFSEQYPLDCGKGYGIGGCDGGWSEDVIQFSRKYGLELREKYPYSTLKEDCPYSKKTSSKKMGYIRSNDLSYKIVSVDAIERYIGQQPLIVSVSVSDDFSAYGGGVHEGSSTCDKNRPHAMLLVGHGRQDGLQFWLFKNSHGRQWGESGYYKLNKKTGRKCLTSALILEHSAGWLGKANQSGPAVNEDYDAQPVEERLAKLAMTLQAHSLFKISYEPLGEYLTGRLRPKSD